MIGRLVPLTPDTTRVLPISLQVGLSSKDRLVLGDKGVGIGVPTHLRSLSTISNTSLPSMTVTYNLHNQVACTSNQDSIAEKPKGSKPHKIKNSVPYLHSFPESQGLSRIHQYATLPLNSFYAWAFQALQGW